MSLPVEEMLRLYYNQYKALDRKGGPEEDGDLFEKVIGLEEEILAKHGLPPSNKNKSILWKLTEKQKLTGKHLAQTLEHLKAAAEKHFFTPVLTDLEQLKEAKSNNRSAFDILPELGHPTHEYTIFLYEQMLNFVSPEEVLAEMSALKRLDCYGEAASLKNQYPRTFRRTKTYKQLKPYLKFLDSYLAPLDPNVFFSFLKDEEDPFHPLEKPRVIDFRDLQDETDKERGDDLLSSAHPEAIAFTPEYVVLTDLIVIEEIIFSEDSAVTVMGHINHPYFPATITLGFDFDMLTSVLQDYERDGQAVLNYFNKSRQLNLIDSPIIISLKDKTGSTLELNKHYFKAYKPLTLGHGGKPETMRERFYIVDETVDRNRYDQQQVAYLRSGLGGMFHHMKNHYYFYLSAKLNGKNDLEARRNSGLEDQVRFEVSRMLYLLEKHGGRAEMK